MAKITRDDGKNEKYFLADFLLESPEMPQITALGNVEHVNK